MLIKWFKKKVGQWAREAWEKAREEQRASLVDAIGTVKEADLSTTPRMRVGFLDAINGRILEIAVAKPHPQHPGHYDWTTELYIIGEGQKLSEAMSLVMTMKGLEK